MGAWVLDWGKLLAGVGGHDIGNAPGIATLPEGDIVILSLALHLRDPGESPKSPGLGGGGVPAPSSS